MKENAARLNAKGGLVMGKDNNTFTLILKRLKRRSRGPDAFQWKRLNITIINVVINTWFCVAVNLQIILYNYFVPMLTVIIQMVGFYAVVKDPQ